ncbi:MAG TPA: O-antigen ligase family protein [Bacteroidales bacterium]
MSEKIGFIQKVKSTFSTHTLLFFLVFLYLLVFHILGGYLAFLFQLDFLIVFPYVFYYYYIKHYANIYFDKAFFNRLKIIFVSLMILNILSVFYGLLLTNYPTSIVGLALSFHYFTMFVYILFGAILAVNYKKLNIILIIEIFSISLISLCLLEYFDVGFANKLKVFYNVYEEMELSNDPNKYRIVGTLKNSNNLGLMMAFLLFLTWFNQGNRVIKTLISIGAVAVVFFSGSRTGFVLLVFVSIFYILNSWSLRNVTVLIAIIIGLFIVSTFYIDYEKTVLYRRLMNTEVESMFYTRQVFYWNDAIEAIKESPILGVGRSEDLKNTVDNFYLNIMKTNGIVGLFLWLYFLSIIGFNAVKNYFSFIEAKLLVGIIGLMLLSSMTADFYFSRLFYPLFMIVIGYYSNLLILKAEEKNKTEKEIKIAYSDKLQ